MDALPFLFIRVYEYLNEIRIRQLFYTCGVHGYLAGIKSKGRFVGMGEELAADDLIPVIAESIILGHGNGILFIVCLYVHLCSPSYLT